MCTIEYGMMLIMIKKQKKKEANKEKKREKKESHLFYIGSDLSKRKTNKQTIYFVEGAVDRYRADLGLSTFNDGRGIFD
jgi:hypothetical protein